MVDANKEFNSNIEEREMFQECFKKIREKEVSNEEYRRRHGYGKKMARIWDGSNSASSRNSTPIASTPLIVPPFS